MDCFAPLDEAVLTRLLACLLQREALALARLAGPWPGLVATNLRRLLIGSKTPLAAVAFAPHAFHRLREVVVDGQGLDDGRPATTAFWTTAATLLRQLPALELERVVVKNIPLQPAGALVESCAQGQVIVSACGTLLVPTLQHLQLEGVGLGGEDAVLTPLRALKQGLVSQRLPQVTSMAFPNCRLHASGCSTLCSAVVASAIAGGLRRLDLSANALGVGGAAELADALQHMARLESLLLGGNVLGPAGVQALANGLVAVRATLTELDMSENGLMLLGIESLAEVALELQSLSLSRNWLDAQDVTALLSLLQPMAATLEQLDLAGNRLGSLGARRLFDEVGSLPALRKLNLRQVIGFACRLSSVAPGLEELTLSSCGLGEDDAVLAVVIAGLPQSLRVLQLGPADLRNPSMAQLLDTLPNMPCLETLRLVQSRIDDATAQAIATRAPLQQLPRLRMLDLTGNSVSRDVAARLEEALRGGTSRGPPWLATTRPGGAAKHQDRRGGGKPSRPAASAALA